MYPARTPALLRLLFSKRVWSMPGSEQVVYLTFDDGPVPQVTPWVLDTLSAFDARATFFVVGDNAERYPELLARIRNDGHAVGNHTWHHVNGWRTTTSAYLHEVERTQQLTGTRLFRPPYGRLSPAQARALHPAYDVIMWDVLSADFDTRVDEERCLQNVLKNTRPGSIVVFHDSVKAEARLRYALPRTLEALSQKGYRFLPLPEDGITAPRK